MAFDFGKRVARLRSDMKKAGLDAFVAATSEDSNKNVYYLSGFGGTTGVLAVSKRDAVLAVDARYTLRAKKEAPGVKVVEVPRGAAKGPHLSLYIEAAVRKLSLRERSRIGFEAAKVPHLWFKTWKAGIKGTWLPTEHIVERLRQVKDREERAHLAHAARVTSGVFRRVSEKIRAGMRETDIARMIDVALLDAGAVAPSFRTIVASGPNSSVPHHETGARKVKAGDPVILDFGGSFPGGYCSDLTRTIFVRGRKPSAKLIDMYRTVLGANQKAAKALCAGMMWKEYDRIARDHIDHAGYGNYFSHGLGHSVGLETHDPYDYAHDPFQAGVVLTNEPGIYIAGVGGVRIEDDLVVTDSGASVLTRAPYLSL